MALLCRKQGSIAVFGINLLEWPIPKLDNWLRLSRYHAFSTPRLGPWLFHTSLFRKETFNGVTSNDSLALSI